MKAVTPFSYKGIHPWPRKRTTAPNERKNHAFSAKCGEQIENVHFQSQNAIGSEMVMGLRTSMTILCF
ncbi:hypothetical protein [uncultured Desulfovibrio sp.]|uniref:hypothetical protein n=1 Tax=uncultured Desulfovibrio sp. TaxID=167968 RepID=UPI00260A62F1|nr:hypothetical protein [uncultured Desulfovibrio sp.]